MGFDRRQAELYMVELVNRGYVVLRVSGDNLLHVRPSNHRTKELRHQRSQAKFMALDPTLVFDAGDLEGPGFDKWVQRLGYGERLETLMRGLRAGDTAALREFGQLFVYPIADWYGPDWELTTMIGGHAILLAKAALLTGQKLPCRVVAPKSQRGRSRRTTRLRSAPAETRPQRLGQLGFDDLTADWPTR